MPLRIHEYRPVDSPTTRERHSTSSAAGPRASRLEPQERLSDQIAVLHAIVTSQAKEIEYLKTQVEASLRRAAVNVSTETTAIEGAREPDESIIGNQSMTSSTAASPERSSCGARPTTSRRPDHTLLCARCGGAAGIPLTSDGEWRDAVDGYIRDRFAHYAVALDDKLTRGVIARLRRVRREHVEVSVEREIQRVLMRRFYDSEPAGAAAGSESVLHELVRRSAVQRPRVRRRVVDEPSKPQQNAPFMPGQTDAPTTAELYFDPMPPGLRELESQHRVSSVKGLQRTAERFARKFGAGVELSPRRQSRRTSPSTPDHRLSPLRLRVDAKMTEADHRLTALEAAVAAVELVHDARRRQEAAAADTFHHHGSADQATSPRH